VDVNGGGDEPGLMADERLQRPIRETRSRQRPGETSKVVMTVWRGAMRSMVSMAVLPWRS
jgi:hypothetical protein